MKDTGFYLSTSVSLYMGFYTHVSYFLLFGRREGQHTQEELQKKNLRDELEERERRHFSSKDKPYSGKIINFKPFHMILLNFSLSFNWIWTNEVFYYH